MPQSPWKLLDHDSLSLSRSHTLKFAHHVRQSSSWSMKRVISTSTSTINKHLTHSLKNIQILTQNPSPYIPWDWCAVVTEKCPAFRERKLSPLWPDLHCNHESECHSNQFVSFILRETGNYPWLLCRKLFHSPKSRHTQSCGCGGVAAWSR